ncbi:MAG: glycosidase, partial [Candidatus Eremiobacteraeota bacterium]|nr:glycosidase [Candidatus Eremiobacteraeota bacterium]
MVLKPNGDPNEAGGVLNPAAARAPSGDLLLYPRCVAEGNISRIGIVRATRAGRSYQVERLHYALEPHAPYELRPRSGYGCEDPRVTYMPALQAYVMAYTAVGPDGPRIAFAVSKDAYDWQRIGLANFSGTGNPEGDDKDGAFFPEAVQAPSGTPSLAFYHRPMLHLS